MHLAFRDITAAFLIKCRSYTKTWFAYGIVLHLVLRYPVSLWTSKYVRSGKNHSSTVCLFSDQCSNFCCLRVVSLISLPSAYKFSGTSNLSLGFKLPGWIYNLFQVQLCYGCRTLRNSPSGHQFSAAFGFIRLFYIPSFCQSTSVFHSYDNKLFGQYWIWICDMTFKFGLHGKQCISSPAGSALMSHKNHLFSPYWHIFFALYIMTDVSTIFFLQHFTTGKCCVEDVLSQMCVQRDSRKCLALSLFSYNKSLLIQLLIQKFR